MRSSWWLAVSLCVAGSALLLSRLEPPGRLITWLQQQLLPAHFFPSPSSGQQRLLTLSELGRYDGQEGSPGLYLAVLGQVFDVSKGAKHYGPGASYQALAGKLVGRFYDEQGRPTEALREVEEALALGHKAKEEKELQKRRFPPCNSEWSAASGSRVWCGKRSGGVERDWVGVPRLLFTPGSSPSCVCVRTTGPPSDRPASSEHPNAGDLEHPGLKSYRECPPLAESCVVLAD
ncbi:neuferricin isoform X2 [Petromyzon marinus]|uniref:Neuferricin n=1 Tax=Petromyzon marinus TaxID=7757 RepID=A0AAJ7T6U7_PETMA|nr:neuferricin isoform X2 [Petromyzon marinus]